MAVIIFITNFEWYPYELVSVLLIFIAVSVPPLLKSKTFGKTVSFINNGTFALYLIHPIAMNAASKIWYKCGFSNNVLYIIYLYVFCLSASYFIYYIGIIRLERLVQNKIKMK